MNKKLLLTILISPIMLSSCNATDTVVTRSIFGCGTVFNMTAYNVSKEKLRTAEDAIMEYSALFDGFETYNNVVNIRTINETNEEIQVSKKLYDALKEADKLYKETDGYFNPYIGELTYAYKESYKENKLPEQEVVDTALENLKTFKFVFNDEKTTVQRIGNSKIDLGAFSKGYILDQTEVILKELVPNYMISAGGSSNYFTSKPGSKAYKAGISYLPNQYVEIKDESLGVSGIFEQYIEINGIKYSHIINPFTGKPVTDYDFSMVINKSNTLTDVISTTLMVCEDDKVTEKIERIYATELKYKVYKDGKCVKEHGDIELKRY